MSQLEFVGELGSYQRYKISKDGKEDMSEFKTIYIFLFRTKETLLKPIDPENPEATWVTKEKVAELISHPKDKEFFLKIKKELTEISEIGKEKGIH